MIPTPPELQDVDELKVGMLRKLKPQLTPTLQATFIETYRSFLTLLYEELDNIIVDMENHRDMLQAKDEAVDYSEDALSHHILFGLRMGKVFSAESVEIAGRTDIHVTFPGKRWRWIGEAKLDNGPSYIAGGFKQLTTRYASFDPEQREGGIFIYCKKGAMATISNNFKKSLQCTNFLEKEKLTEHDIVIEKCKSQYRYEFSFYTNSILPDLGGDRSIRYKTRVMPIALRHLPQDSSGKDSEMYIQRRAGINIKGGDV